MNSQLLCTFSNLNNIDTTISDIKNHYNLNLLFNRIFILQENNTKELFLTYNVDCNKEYLQKTISLHRIKQYNCLYTINALNQLIRDENNGVLDESYKIEWKHFPNTIIITVDGFTKIIPTKLYKIVNL